ncbi:hypothetical protein [Maridesulfovibrio ferrireducens]|uniref:EH signature domain-containing protein n=1 Tax=Maridesulfovibrio ferrireducens TaxID=246191 RepID=UPI001A20DA97|nr:hypothetical protein [Maridesulfovibrio ferrireducens]MBI9113199.1 hypothetical protein [Maridesulfovibrio ferrireducens]
MNLKLKFTIPSISLPKIATPESATFYEKTAVKLERFSSEAGRSSKSFQERLRKFKKLSELRSSLKLHVHSLQDVRSLIFLWGTDDEFLKAVPVTESWFQRFKSISEKASRLGLLAFVALYFDKYDLLDEGLVPLQKYLKSQFKLRNKKTLPSGLVSVFSYSNLLFRDNAPRIIVERGINSKLSHATILDKCGVPQSRSSRFNFICQNLYYVENLKKLYLGQQSSVLTEILKKKVYEA